MPRPWWAKLWPYGPLVRSDLGVERREQAADALDGAYYSAVIDATVSEYVMTQVKVIVDLKLASMRTLEGKAAQIVGFAGTVTAVVGVFGRNVPGPLLPGTVGFLLASIVCNLRGMAIRQDDVPSPSLYNISRVAENPVNKARIAMALAEAYTDYSLDLQHEAGLKARWINTGSVFFIAGLIGLLWIALIPNIASLIKPGETSAPKCYTQPQRGSPQHARAAATTATCTAGTTGTAVTTGHAAPR